MTEVARFFDSTSYGEADQAEVQSRFRPTGVVGEAGSRLAVSAPGGLFVRVADGEAIVEGFWYKNTSNLDLAVSNNTSGSTRHDRVVLRLNRTTNELKVVVVQGTPGVGVPALVQIVGGTWDFPLAILTIPTGTLAITPVMVSDQRTYGLNPDRRRNRLHNASFRVNQRGTGALSGNGYLVDRWQYAAQDNTPGFTAQRVEGMPLDGETPGGLYIARTLSAALLSTSFIAIHTYFEGVHVAQMNGQTLCLSFYSFSNKAGIFNCNLQQFPSGHHYTASWAHAYPGQWQKNVIVVPWSVGSGWDVTTSAASMGVSFVIASGSTHMGATPNAWTSVLTGQWASTDHSNALSAVSDYLTISRPKLEVGTYPTPFEMLDITEDALQCYRYLWIDQDTSLVGSHVSSNIYITAHHVLPVNMRAAPTFSHSAPTVTSGAPTGNQIAFSTGLGYAAPSGSVALTSWTMWMGVNRRVNSIITTASTIGFPAGLEHTNIVLGSGAQARFSAELP